MDDTTRQLAAFAAEFELDGLSSEALHAIKRQHLDGVACGAGGFSGTPAEILRGMASGVTVPEGASAYGVEQRTTPESAALANAVANRYLDWNDTYAGSAVGGCHPTDMAPAILAATELARGSGRDLLSGLFVAYEAIGAVADAIPVRPSGWDQGLTCAIGAVAGAGRVLGLTVEQMGHALSIAITTNFPLRVARIGGLSHWKAAASGYGSMAGLFAARLAQGGITGPDDVFESAEGAWTKLSGPVELPPLGVPVDGRTVAERTLIKLYPAEMNTLAPAHLMIQLRESFDLDDIDAIDIFTYELAWHEVGGGQGDRKQKWDPQTREGADHSIPYITAVALVDGEVTLNSFLPDRLSDAALRPVMQKIDVHTSDELTKRFEGPNRETACRIRVRTESGKTFEEEVSNVRGHPDNPISDAELEAKYQSVASHVMSDEDAALLLDKLWNLEALTSVDELTAILRRWAVR